MLSNPRNAKSLCIIFDGLDEYPPAYNDPSNYIYKIINREELITATVILLSRPEALYEKSGTSFYQEFELVGFDKSGIEEFVSKNIPDKRHAKHFLEYLTKHPAVFHLCTSPLHLTMFVESVKDKKFPSSLTEAFIKSFSIFFEREIMRNDIVGCSNVELTDLTSLRLCNSDLADAIVNVSRLAYDSLMTHDSEDTIKYSAAELRSYLPSGENFGLLSFQPADEPGTVAYKFSFPHKVIQEFWAAFYTVVYKEMSKHALLFGHQESHITDHRHYFYFACGLYSSNNLLPSAESVVEMLQNRTWIGFLSDYTMCGLESGHKHHLLAAAYLRRYGTKLDVDHLMPYSPQQVEVQSLLVFLHSNITQISFTDYSPSLERYLNNITDPFPNLHQVDIPLSSIERTIHCQV